MYAKYFKRGIDFILSLCALIVLSPVLLILIILGTVFMGGNPFFTQERPGKAEKIFKLIKFRTMSDKKDKDGNLLPDELRLNKYGKFLRASSLDELPELINILKGDMAIIGPRPLLVRYLARYNEEQHHRHDVRPGLAVVFGFMLHVRKKNRQRYSEACRPIIGKHADGILGRIIDLFALFALLAGTATTFSVATPLMAAIIVELFGITISRTVVTIIILLITCAVYTYKLVSLLWCILLIVLPIALVFSESSMNNIQSISIISAFPIGIIMIIMIWGFIKDIKIYMKKELKGKEWQNN